MAASFCSADVQSDFKLSAAHILLDVLVFIFPFKVNKII